DPRIAGAGGTAFVGISGRESVVEAVGGAGGEERAGEEQRAEPGEATERRDARFWQGVGFRGWVTALVVKPPPSGGGRAPILARRRPGVKESRGREFDFCGGGSRFS